MPSEAEIRENWPTDADDLVNGIPETVKAAKSMGFVPPPGNDPDSQLRVTKQLTGLGLDEVTKGVRDLGLQSGPVTPKDRRNAVRRQNEVAEQAAANLENAEGWNPVKHAAAVDRGEDPAVAAREDALSSAGSSENDEPKTRSAEQRKAAAGDDKARGPAGRSSEPKSQT